MRGLETRQDKMKARMIKKGFRSFVPNVPIRVAEKIEKPDYIDCRQYASAEFVDGVMRLKDTHGGTNTYFFLCETGVIKIGVSISPEERLKNVEGPYKLTLLGYIPWDVERLLHDMFKHCNRRTVSPALSSQEWFYPHPELVGFIQLLDSKLNFMSEASRNALGGLRYPETGFTLPFTYRVPDSDSEFALPNIWRVCDNTHEIVDALNGSSSANCPNGRRVYEHTDLNFHTRADIRIPENIFICGNTGCPVGYGVLGEKVLGKIVTEIKEIQGDDNCEDKEEFVRIGINKIDNTVFLGLALPQASVPLMPHVKNRLFEAGLLFKKAAISLYVSVTEPGAESIELINSLELFGSARSLRQDLKILASKP